MPGANHGGHASRFADRGAGSFGRFPSGARSVRSTRLDLAVRAAIGPTRVIRYLAGETLVKSVLLLGPHEPLLKDLRRGHRRRRRANHSPRVRWTPSSCPRLSRPAMPVL